MSSHDVDYAVPADVPRSRRRERAERPAGPLWGGRQRTWLQVGCWALAALLAVPLLVPLLRAETGADSPEDAVEELLQGIADTDPVAVVAALDPVETDDPDRAADAYDRLSSRLLRTGEVPPADVTAVLAAAERQLDGSVDLTTVATVAALDLELADLTLSAQPAAGTTGSDVPVLIEGGDLEVALDPARLPESVTDLSRASYTMPLAEGWRRDRRVVLQPFLVAVERDGRWYVSLEASADALLPEFGDRP